MRNIPLTETKPKIRLSTKETEAIRATVGRVLGDGVSIRIFGSRAQADDKGGDIDILIETKEVLANRVACACRITSELQMCLGEQKIDVLIVDPATREQTIHQIARQTGVLL